MSVDSVDASPPPPPPPPPPDYSAADQPVTDSGEGPPEDTSQYDADTAARDGLGDLAPADAPMTDDGQAPPDLASGEVGAQSGDAGHEAPGAGQDAPGADQPGSADAGPVGLDTVLDESGGPALADLPMTDDGQAAPDLTSGEPVSDGNDNPGSGDGYEAPGVAEPDPDASTAQDGESPGDDLAAGSRAAPDQATRTDTPIEADQPDKAIESAQAIELDTDAGSAYYAPNDIEMREAAEQLKPEDGSYTVDMHGDPTDPDHVCFQIDNDTWETLTADQLSTVIKDNDGYDGEPVRLFSCYAGQDPPGGGDSFGQQLANSLGVDVTAPTTSVTQDSQGNPVVLDGGVWRTFQPKK